MMPLGVHLLVLGQLVAGSHVSLGRGRLQPTMRSAHAKVASVGCMQVPVTTSEQFAKN